MKKNFFAFLLLMLIFNIRIFGGNFMDASPQARYSFKKDYPGALHATWERVYEESIYAVRFVNGNEAAVAYYNEEGDRIAFARVIKMPALPGAVKVKINGMFKEEEIKSVQELVMNQKTCYFFETERNGVKKLIGVYSNGHLKHARTGE
ncbi:MAG: hypothetical protein H7Y86_13810 [Rhizobacter sp.]|nr:hypothetical protein [Ferruginibacter sp.]